MSITVQDLMGQLSKLPPKTKVFSSTNGNPGELVGVELCEDLEPDEHKAWNTRAKNIVILRTYEIE